jgi:hypothetical protein
MARLTECEVPWLEDAQVTRALQLKTRGTPMRAPSNDYIGRIKTYAQIRFMRRSDDGTRYRYVCA